MTEPSFFHRTIAASLAWMVFFAGLTAAGSVVFEPREDAVGFCKDRNILVLDSELPRETPPENPVDDAECSSASSITWYEDPGSAFTLIPDDVFVRMITTAPGLIERLGQVETPPPRV